MTDDFYCDEVFSGGTEVRKVAETDNVLAYYHTKPFWPVHIVVVPKAHIDSLLAITEEYKDLLFEIIEVVQEVSTMVVKEHGACAVLTNLGTYQDSKHLHWHVTFGEPLR